MCVKQGNQACNILYLRLATLLWVRSELTDLIRNQRLITRARCITQGATGVKEKGCHTTITADTEKVKKVTFGCSGGFIGEGDASKMPGTYSAVRLTEGSSQGRQLSTYLT